jgi:hypothetical protein
VVNFQYVDKRRCEALNWRFTVIDPSLEFLDSILEQVFDNLAARDGFDAELECLAEVWEFDRGQRKALAALSADDTVGAGRVDSADSASPKQRSYLPWFSFRTSYGTVVNTYVEVEQ